MNFFRRLFLKLTKQDKPESPPSQRAAEVTYHITEPAPAPSMMTPVELDYLKRYPDVAKHEYFGSHPYEHYIKHGKAEGRTWGIQAVKVDSPPPLPPEPEPRQVENPSPVVFTFGKGIDWASLINKKDVARAELAAGNFDFLMVTGGEAPAFDYIISHVPGGAAMFRQVWDSRGFARVESARLVNKYGTFANKGYVDKDTNEYVLGGNPFTKEGGIRYKLPNVVPLR